MAPVSGKKQVTVRKVNIRLQIRSHADAYQLAALDFIRSMPWGSIYHAQVSAGDLEKHLSRPVLAGRGGDREDKVRRYLFLNYFL